MQNMLPAVIFTATSKNKTSYSYQTIVTLCRDWSFYTSYLGVIRGSFYAFVHFHEADTRNIISVRFVYDVEALIMKAIKDNFAKCHIQ